MKEESCSRKVSFPSLCIKSRDINSSLHFRVSSQELIRIIENGSTHVHYSLAFRCRETRPREDSTILKLWVIFKLISPICGKIRTQLKNNNNNNNNSSKDKLKPKVCLEKREEEELSKAERYPFANKKWTKLVLVVQKIICEKMFARGLGCASLIPSFFPFQVQKKKIYRQISFLIYIYCCSVFHVNVTRKRIRYGYCESAIFLSIITPFEYSFAFVETNDIGTIYCHCSLTHKPRETVCEFYFFSSLLLLLLFFENNCAITSHRIICYKLYDNGFEWSD